MSVISSPEFRSWMTVQIDFSQSESFLFYFQSSQLFWRRHIAHEAPIQTHTRQLSKRFVRIGLWLTNYRVSHSNYLNLLPLRPIAMELRMKCFEDASFLKHHVERRLLKCSALSIRRLQWPYSIYCCAASAEVKANMHFALCRAVVKWVCVLYRISRPHLHQPIMSMLRCMQPSTLLQSMELDLSGGSTIASHPPFEASVHINRIKHK